MLSRRLFLLLTAILAPALQAGCDGSPFAPGPPPPSSLRIAGPAAHLLEGDSARFTATVLNAAGQPIPAPVWGMPRWSTDTDAVVVTGNGVVHAVAPGDALVRVEVGDLTASRPLRVDPHTVTLDVAGAYLVQTVQRLDGSIPILAGRSALLRVFPVGNKAVNDYKPTVRVHVYHGGTEVDQLLISPRGGSLPHRVQEGSATSSWNAVIPAHQVQPGLGIRVVLDPDGAVERTGASTTVFPADGGVLRIDVRTLPPHRVRFVPVRQAVTGTTGNVTEANAPGYLELFRRVFPVPSIEHDVRAPYTTHAEVRETDGWIQLLQELAMIRTAEGSSGYYYGVVRPHQSRWGGYAMIGAPVAVGYDRADLTSGGWSWGATLFAHEVGHNFGRRHAPCGSAQGVDAGYPYPGAAIGIYGYDVVRDLILDAESTRDLMSYCYDWVSDYTYLGVWSFRRQEAASAGSAFASARQEAGPALLVWGRIEPDGRVRLEPAFELDRVVPGPTEPGPFTLTAFDTAGRVLFARSFNAAEVAHGPGTRIFSLAVPLGGVDGGAVHRLRVDGPTHFTERVASVAPGGRRIAASARIHPHADGVRIQWDARRHAAALIRDPDSGDILAVAREGEISVPMPRGSVDVILSHGTGSVRARLE
jgi:hypothetical protein